MSIVSSYMGNPVLSNYKILSSSCLSQVIVVSISDYTSTVNILKIILICFTMHYIHLIHNLFQELIICLFCSSHSGQLHRNLKNTLWKTKGYIMYILFQIFSQIKIWCYWCPRHLAYIIPASFNVNLTQNNNVFLYVYTNLILKIIFS